MATPEPRRDGNLPLIVIAAKFGVVGLLSIAIYFALMALLRSVIPSVAMLAGASYVGSAVFNYIAQSRVTFGAKAADGGALLRYFAMHGFCMVLNSSAMHLLVAIWGLNLWLSQLGVTGLVAATSFGLSYLWVYRPTKL